MLKESFQQQDESDTFFFSLGKWENHDIEENGFKTFQRLWAMSPRLQNNNV
jgi:hypothetical protein